MYLKTILLSIAAVFLLVLIPYNNQAQVRMSFCMNLENNGDFTGCGNQFTLPNEGGQLKVVLLALGKKLNTAHIEYVIYRDTTYYTTIHDNNVCSASRYCYHILDFSHEGNYTISVYDMDRFDNLAQDYGVLISCGKVSIKLKSAKANSFL